MEKLDRKRQLDIWHWRLKKASISPQYGGLHVSKERAAELRAEARQNIERLEKEINDA